MSKKNPEKILEVIFAFLPTLISSLSAIWRTPAERLEKKKARVDLKFYKKKKRLEHQAAKREARAQENSLQNLPGRPPQTDGNTP